jgi:hypothetical protein
MQEWKLLKKYFKLLNLSKPMHFRNTFMLKLTLKDKKNLEL